MFYPELKSVIPYLCSVFCLLAQTTTQALPEDVEQPIYISSNSAIKDDKQGVTTYQGDVEMSQGTLDIKADQVTIYTEADAIYKIIALGKPATFKQQPKPHTGDVLAEGDTIEYHVKDKVITLLNNASLTQGDGSSITGNKIEYDINAARAEAKAGGTEERVNVVIPAPQQTP
ncbi:MAG: lipopolysaccharide transport periplasmic protein LptA [Cellvibrionaceae bacterium]|nr:lipopolysaccharide transport periplasmic protein LptA [Cellvibrionaceae bacterium]